MGKGLQRARAAAAATRTETCPACGRTVKVSLENRVFAAHGLKGKRCPGSGTRAG